MKKTQITEVKNERALLPIFQKLKKIMRIL